MSPKKEILQSINPATLEVYAEIEATDPAELKAIVAEAREAQREWWRIGFDSRIEYLMRFRDIVLDRLDEVAEVITKDNGKTLFEALNSEVYPALDMVRFCAKDARKALRDEPLNNPMFNIARIESDIVFEPLGVVGIISPWNFPFSIPVTQVLVALTAGNAVVLKTAELTAGVGDLIRRLFEDAGLPKRVLTVVQGLGNVVGEAMMDAGFDKISFTGSVPVGRHLMQRASETLTPITLELGGKDPFIVLEDADIERAASAAVWGAFLNAGQVCASVERVYVHKKIADKFIKLVVEKTKKIRVGNGLDQDMDMGPMISEKQMKTVESHIADAVKKGARILAGGNRIKSLPGWFFEPTVLADVTHDMLCMKDETFGPTLPIMEFSTVDEAVALANDSRYGLNSSVWSRDEARAREIARRIQAGTVVINDAVYTYGFAQCPWGGVKESGIGRTHSVHGLLEFTSIKNVTLSRSPIRDDIWWFPYSDRKYDAMKAAMKTLYCGGMACRVGGMTDIVNAFAPRKSKKR